MWVYRKSAPGVPRLCLKSGYATASLSTREEFASEGETGTVSASKKERSSEQVDMQTVPLSRSDMDRRPPLRYKDS